MLRENVGPGGNEAAEAAALLAIDALAFVAADRILFGRFLRLTGLELENLREVADDPSFLVGVLDFMLADERLVVEFSAGAGTAPSQIAVARRLLAGDERHRDPA